MLGFWHSEGYPKTELTKNTIRKVGCPSKFTDAQFQGSYTHQPDEPFFGYGGVKMKETLNKLRNNPS